VEHFQNLEAKSIRDVPFGACIAFTAASATYIGIHLRPHHPGDDSTIAVLWECEQGRLAPKIVSLESLSGDEVVVFLGAMAILPTDPAHIRFRYRQRAEPHGALFLANGEPHVTVQGPDNSSVAVRLRDGVRAEVGISNLPWFSSWTVASPSIDGRWSTICRIEWRSESA
jgi:hypothetical protein